MSANTYFQNPKVLARLREDPLGPHIDLYAEQLITEGHCHQSGGRCLRVVGDFNRWLKRKRSGINGIDEIAVERYLSFRQRYRHPFMSDRPALNRLLAVLRNAGLISEPTTKFLDPLAQIEHDFEHFLLLERGLCQASVVRHRTPLRKFIQEHCSQGPASFSALTAADIIGFVERHAHEQSPRSAQSMCWTLRAFTRYLQFCGYIVSDLAASIPSVRTWRFTAIPDRLSSEQVQQTLDACDRRSPIGQRDYAVLLLLARLGLRANEIAMLTLDDVDWYAGRLSICAKGRQRVSMPLLTEVGEAVAEYLEHGRPHTDSRRLFVRAIAPHTGFGVNDP